MIEEHLFVGGVAIVLGAVSIAAAIFNWDACYQLHKSRWIESLCGRRGVRIFYALLGISLIVLGAAISLGFGPNRSTSVRSPSSFLGVSNQ